MFKKSSKTPQQSNKNKSIPRQITENQKKDHFKNRRWKERLSLIKGAVLRLKADFSKTL